MERLFCQVHLLVVSNRHDFMLLTVFFFSFLVKIQPSDCHCHNPFNLSQAGTDKPGWQEVFDMNLKLLNETSTERLSSLDLVLYGDSIVERLNGRVFGDYKETLNGQAKITNEIFTKGGGRGTVDGLALGIAGDEVSNDFVFWVVAAVFFRSFLLRFCFANVNCHKI